MTDKVALKDYVDDITDDLGTQIDAIAIAQTTASVGYATQALLFADLAHAAGTRGYVNADPTPANNGNYLKNGASGAGSWIQSPFDRVVLVENDVAFLKANFVAKSTSNKADPNVADAALPTFASQTSRIYNSGGGTLAAQSPTTLGSFSVTRKYNVVAGQQYTISMHGANGNWGFYFTSAGTQFIGFYNSDGTFNQNLTAGFTDQNGAFPAAGNTTRSITFTVPAGCAKVAFNLRNTIDFSNTTPVTTAALQSLVGAIMLNTGAIALDFVPFVAAGSLAPDSAIFQTLPVTHSIIVAVQDRYVYVRTPNQQGANDIVWRMLYSETPAYGNKTGVMDFYGAREIARATSVASTIAAFNKATGAIWDQGTDERAPLHINGMYLGATHGIVGYVRTLAAHGLTDANVGSTATDGAAKVWVLAKVVDANNLFWIADNTGASDKWTITTAVPTGATLTWVAGGTNYGAKTFTATVQGQLTPILQNQSVALFMDDVQLVADGVYTGEKFRIEDLWDLPNAAALLSYLKAHIGSVDYTNAAIAVQVSVSNVYTWNRWGAMTLERTEHVKQAYKRTAGSPGDYSGGLQLQRLSLVGDTPAGVANSVYLYVPDIGVISGYDFKNIANITANALFVNITKAACTNPADPASHFAMLGKNAVPAVVSGLAWGISRKAGYGVPATRAAKVTDVAYMSAAEKMYPIWVDAAAGDAVANEVLTATEWKTYFPNSDPNLTIPGVVFSAFGRDYAVVTSHIAQGPRWVALPKQLIGKPVSVLKADANVTVHSPVVQSRGVLMTFATAYGDVILEIG